MEKNDHDLLIRLDENMRNLTGEVKMLRDGTIARINELEANKLNTSIFYGYKSDTDRSIGLLFKGDNDMKKIAYIGMGIVFTIQFITLVVLGIKG